MKTYQKLLFIICFIICIAQGSSMQANCPPITIYVHGTRVIPHFLIKKLFHCTDGFHKAKEIDAWYQQHKIAQWISSSNKKEFPLNSFYIFCWFGGLSVSGREKASRDLYNHIQKLVKQYRKKYKCDPKINLIAHSHGCNVILNMAKIAKRKPNIIINNLIFLACPVQKATKELIASDMFGKVFSFYSTVDSIQWLDPQRLSPQKRQIFSDRIFPPDAKLKQANITIDGSGLFHIQFLYEKLNRMLPHLVNYMNGLKEAGSIPGKHFTLHMRSKDYLK